MRPAHLRVYQNQHGICRIGMIGFHPALLEEAAKVFGPENLAVMDLNPHHIGLFFTRSRGVGRRQRLPPFGRFCRCTAG